MPSAEFRVLVRSYEARILDRAQQHGIIVHQPNAAQLQAWQRATADNRRQLTATIAGEGDAIVQLLNQGLRAYAGE